jgi:hypothetical protein
MTIERDDPASAHYCEQRMKRQGNSEHQFSDRKVIVNRRNKVRIVLVKCHFCGRNGKREEVPFP